MTSGGDIPSRDSRMDIDPHGSLLLIGIRAGRRRRGALFFFDVFHVTGWVVSATGDLAEDFDDDEPEKGGPSHGDENAMAQRSPFDLLDAHGLRPSAEVCGEWRCR